MPNEMGEEIEDLGSNPNPDSVTLEQQSLFVEFMWTESNNHQGRLYHPRLTKWWCNRPKFLESGSRFEEEDERGWKAVENRG